MTAPPISAKATFDTAEGLENPACGGVYFPGLLACLLR